MSALLEVEGLTAGYGEVTVLRGVGLAAAADAVTAVLGSNGAGKTTLLRAVAGIIPSAGGRIRFAGADVTRLPASARVAAGLVLVPEGRLLFPDFSVEENLRIGAQATRPSGRELARRLDGIYELFPALVERRRQRASSLSGGEQQMVALGRGLMAEPRLLLLDEPTLGLAPALARQVFALVGRIRAGGRAVLLAEQDVAATLAVADHGVVLEQGAVALAGSAQALLADRGVRLAYLGV